MKKSVFMILVFCCFSVVFAQNKPDALSHYLKGRKMDTVNRKAEAKEEYNKAVEICSEELRQNPNNLDSYAVYTWSLFRLHKYNETIAICNKALQIKEDPRIIETLGEAYFYVNNMNESLRQMQKYISLNPRTDRASVAYFFQGEIYRIRKQFAKADIAYTAAVSLEPNLPLWWFKLGSVREAENYKTGAIEAYSRALKLSPNYTEAKKGLERLSQ
ncbi:MAG: hypothetical protein CR988_00645 [Treponema sp.]|nr:MAG: hypothetical protein CR988_00645 [Treponema sp.]